MAEKKLQKKANVVKDVTKSTKIRKPKKVEDAVIVEEAVVVSQAEKGERIHFDDWSKQDLWAVVDINGSQEIVFEGLEFDVNSLGEIAESDKYVSDKVLVTFAGGETKIGTPFVDGAKVECEVVKNFRGPKGVTRDFKAKSRFRKAHGFRQSLTKLKVTKISL